MKIHRTQSFKRDYKDLPRNIKRRAEKQFNLLLKDPRHPSLGISKMEGYKEIWEGRITKKYRFTFQIIDDTYLLRRIGTHEILRWTAPL